MDNHLLALNKPHGLLTQPSNTSEDNLEDFAKDFIKKKFQKPGKVFLTPIHRLDRVTSGIVLFARTSKALKRLQVMMKNREIKKTYRARIEGALPQDSGTLTNEIVHDEYKARISKAKTKESKTAILHYKIIKDNLVEVILETGRYHQIRAQFANIGCPIVGDTKYGAKKGIMPQRIELVHAKMEFIHPVTKEMICLQI